MARRRVKEHGEICVCGIHGRIDMLLEWFNISESAVCWFDRGDGTDSLFEEADR